MADPKRSDPGFPSLGDDPVTAVPDGDDAVARRLVSWRGGYTLQTAEDDWLFTQVVVCSVQVDRCQAHERSLRVHFADRAGRCWDDDRRLEAEELGATLTRRSPPRSARAGSRGSGARGRRACGTPA